MSSSTVYDGDVLLVPCEWDDGKVTHERVLKGEESCLQIAVRPSAKLTRVGAELGRATWLTDLNFYWHRLDSLPDELSALTGLQRLHLSHNALRRVPACVLRLSALQTLSLRGNPLEELPDEIGDLQALICLDMAFCPHLHWLPSSVARLTCLEDLAFDKRTILWLPSTIRSMAQVYTPEDFQNERASSAELNRLLDDCHERERTFLTEFAIGLAPLNLPVLLMTLIWERVHGARMPDAAGWFVSEQRRWLVFDLTQFTRRRLH